MHNPRGCWRECAAAALVLFCANGLNFNAFAVYIPYLTEQLELSYSQSSNFILVRTLLSFGSMFFVKFYYDKLELRMGMTLALALTALSTILYASAGSFTVLCIAAAISGLACAPLTGMIVSVSGNYQGFYILAAVLMIFATVVIQAEYAKLGRRKKNSIERSDENA